MASSEEIRATVERYAEIWSRGAVDELVELFSPDATIEDPVGSELRRGHDGLREFWELVHGMSDGLEMVITGPIRVAGHEAAFPMQALSNVGDDRLVLDIIDTMTFDEAGRITTMRAYWDAADMRPA